jgi:hypothetical protein
VRRQTPQRRVSTKDADLPIFTQILGGFVVMIGDDSKTVSCRAFSLEACFVTLFKGYAKNAWINDASAFATAFRQS